MRVRLLAYQERSKHRVVVCSQSGDQVDVDDARITELGPYSLWLNVNARGGTVARPLEVPYENVISIRDEAIDNRQDFPVLTLNCGIRWLSGKQPQIWSRSWTRSDDAPEEMPEVEVTTSDHFRRPRRG